MITTKDNLCEVAISMFKEIGYEKVSINMICKQLKVTRGSFYHHFNSKNELLLYWFSVQVEKNITMDLSLASPKQILKKHALDYANIINKVGYDFMYHILMAEFELEGKHFYTYFQLEAQSIALINKAMEHNEIHSSQSAKQLLDTFAAAIIGVIVTWKFENGAFDIVSKIETVLETIYK